MLPFTPHLLVRPKPPGAGYSANALQFFARITDPGSTRKNAYAAIIDSLTTNGIWAKLDALWILAADISGNAAVNLVSSSYPLTPVGSPTFTANQGYQANVSGTDRIDTAFNPTTASSPQYVQNSAHLSVWCRDTSGTSSGAAIGWDTGENLFPYFTDNNLYARINDSVELGGFTVATANGFSVGNRSGASNREVYRDGSSIGTSTSNTSTAPLNHNVTICGINGNSWTVGKVAAASIGSSLSSTDVSNFYTALNTNKWW